MQKLERNSAWSSDIIFTIMKKFAQSNSFHSTSRDFSQENVIFSQPNFNQDSSINFQNQSEGNLMSSPGNTNSELPDSATSSAIEQDHLLSIIDEKKREEQKLIQQHSNNQTANKVAEANPIQPVGETLSSSDEIQIDALYIQPSTVLLMSRLLTTGFVLWLIFVLLAMFIGMLQSIFGTNFITFFENKVFSWSIGILIYLFLGLLIYKQWSHTLYTVTARQLIIDKGWIFKKRHTRDMAQFGGVQVTQGFWGKILNFGDLRLDYQGAIGRVAGERMHDIPNPFWHEAMIQRLLKNR